MVDVLLILDGASEPLGDAPTTLELAVTPALDELASQGRLTRRLTVAPGLAPGSESAIPALLGWIPHAAVDRAAVEAAARGIGVPDGCEAWRVDVLEHGRRASEARTLAVADGLRREGYVLTPLGGHRTLVTGHAPLPPAFDSPRLRVWPRGIVPPRVLDARTVMIAAPGAAAGIARLMGATVVTPPGATGQADTDLGAKLAAAVGALGSADRVVVHVAAADEAAHELDRARKVAVIERIDRELVGGLAAAVRAAGGSLTVCPDHGCDPRTGRHDAEPVPFLTWPAERAGGLRFTERAAAA